MKKQPAELEGMMTMLELARELQMLKTTLEYYWTQGLIKPSAIRIMGWGDVITDATIIHDPEALKNLGKRYQFYFDVEKTSERIKKIQYLQKEQRLSIKEIQKYFHVGKNPVRKG